VTDILQVKDLMVFYENAIAINDLSIKVQTHEILVVLGSNSAGKTTLMNAVSGLILDMKKKEDRKGGTRITLMGQILFEGQDVTSMGPAKRVRTGIVLCQERHPVFRESHVLENLKISGYLNPPRLTRERIAYVFELFPALKALQKRRAGLLSGGEQQMLAIGIALVAGPKLLLMDEPLLGLAPLVQAELARSMKRIRRQGITLVVTEQFARPLIPVVDRGYVVENGMLVFEGSKKELSENPEVRAGYVRV
jgi:branched-chain amino acid transport system ATP-binding protein